MMMREDKISELPDHVLASILSQLTLKEAIRTSILSTRWRYLWTHITRLNFHISAKRRFLSRKEKLSYANHINHVLNFHKCDFLESFRIALPLLDDCHHPQLDKWIKFALSKKLEALEIDLTDLSRIEDRTTREYVLPHPHPLLLMLNDEVVCNPLPSSASFVAYLKSLSLKYVALDDQMAKIFLSRCPLLEHFSIQQSSKLKNLEVTGASSRLKHFEILDIHEIDSIKICNVVGLESFRSRNTRCEELVLENVPSLVQVDIDPLICREVSNFSHRMSHCLDQLVKLILRVKQCELWNLARHMAGSGFREMKKVNVLKLEIVGDSSIPDTPLLLIIPLLWAFPYLRKLMIQIEWFNVMDFKRPLTQLKYILTSKHLKVVKFAGYSGRVSELELANFLFSYAIALEKFVVDPRSSTDPKMRLSKYARVLRGRTHRELQQFTPAGVKLIVI